VRETERGRGTFITSRRSHREIGEAGFKGLLISFLCKRFHLKNWKSHFFSSSPQ
jgi:hypothetical protein